MCPRSAPLLAGDQRLPSPPTPTSRRQGHCRAPDRPWGTPWSYRGRHVARASHPWPAGPRGPPPPGPGRPGACPGPHAPGARPPGPHASGPGRDRTSMGPDLDRTCPGRPGATGHGQRSSWAHREAGRPPVRPARAPDWARRGTRIAPRRRRRPGGQAGVAAPPGSTAPSCLRDRIPSFVNTFRKCHSMVCGLRNSCAPISRLVSPSPASRAIWAS